MTKRIPVNMLLRAIQAEAECAQKHAQFQQHIEHIHRIVTVIENRMRRFEEQQHWTMLDRLMAEAGVTRRPRWEDPDDEQRKAVVGRIQSRVDGYGG